MNYNTTDPERIIKLYKQGVARDIIAERLGTTTNYIGIVLARRGIPTEKMGIELTPELIKAVKEMRRLKYSVREIKEKHKLTDYYVYKILKIKAAA